MTSVSRACSDGETPHRIGTKRGAAPVARIVNRRSYFLYRNTLKYSWTRPGVLLTAGLWNFKPSLPLSPPLSLFFFLFSTFSISHTHPPLPLIRNTNFPEGCPKLAFGLPISVSARARARPAVCSTTCIKMFRATARRVVQCPRTGGWAKSFSAKKTFLSTSFFFFSFFLVIYI